jgi:CRP/FNR family cyclic AMP-dependent transcriptional regulator
MIELIQGTAVGECALGRRFWGEAGRRQLVDAFLRSKLVRGDHARELAEELAEASEVVVVEAGRCFIVQGSAETDLFQILAGEVEIECNGRFITSRKAGEHVGELTLIDSEQCRAATVRAKVRTVLARIREPAFTRIAAKHSALWRMLAIEAATRHRQRLYTIPQRNDRPHIFIGSSSEALPIAEAIRDGIKRDSNEIHLWSQDVFKAGDTTIETLERQVARSDFAVLVLSHDDVVNSRGARQSAPRDNVVFELGLFMGALTRKRVIVLKPGAKSPPGWWARLRSPHSARVKIPSDLLGLTTLEYCHVEGQAQTKSLAACYASLLEVIAQGPK